MIELLNKSYDALFRFHNTVGAACEGRVNFHFADVSKMVKAFVLFVLFAVRFVRLSSVLSLDLPPYVILIQRQIIQAFIIVQEQFVICYSYTANGNGKLYLWNTLERYQPYILPAAGGGIDTHPVANHAKRPVKGIGRESLGYPEISVDHVDVAIFCYYRKIYAVSSDDVEHALEFVVGINRLGDDGPQLTMRLHIPG